jgi:hypothetical protein
VDPAEKYLKGMRTKFGYFATWLPNEHVDVGDVGILRGSFFIRVTSLSQRGIESKVRKGSKPIAGPAPKVGMSIDFSGREAFAFKATQCYVDSLEDVTQIERAIIEKFKEADWLAEWHVVTRSVRASTATILVSHGDQAKLELSSEGKLQGLGDIGVLAGVEVAREEGSITKLLGVQGLTPLFQLGVLKSKFFTGGRSLTILGITAMDSITPLAAATDKNGLESLYFEQVLPSDAETQPPRDSPSGR